MGFEPKSFSLDVRLNFSGSRGSLKEKEKVHRLYFSTCLGLMGNFMLESPGKTQINYQVSIYFIGEMLSWNWAVSEVVCGLGEGACVLLVSATSLCLNGREGHIHLGQGATEGRPHLGKSWLCISEHGAFLGVGGHGFEVLPRPWSFQKGQLSFWCSIFPLSKLPQ